MDNGIKASKAGTGLRKSFMKLNEQGIPFGQTLQHLADGSMSLNQAQKLVGTTAANQLLILAQNKDKVSELTNEYRTNTTRLDEMADAMGKTTHARIKKMQSAIEGMKLEMGALIADALIPVINKITTLAGNFSKLDDSTKKSILKFAAVAAAIGPVLLAIGALVGIFGQLFLVVKKVATVGFTLFTNPIGIVVGLVAALAAGILYLIGNWDTFVLKVAESSGPIRSIVTGLLEGVQGFIGINPKLQGTIMAIDILSGKIQSGDFDPPDSQWKTFGDTMKDLVSDVAGFDLDILSGLFGGIESPSVEEDGMQEAGSGGGGQADIEKAYDAIFGQGAWAAFQEDKRLRQEQLEAAQRWKASLTELGLGIANSFAQSFADVILSGENLLQGLGNIFKDIAKQIAAMIIKAAILAAIFAMIPGLGQASAASGAFGGSTGFTGILQGMMGGAFADGGQPPVGKISLIGEQGPELFVPNQSGTVIPNGAFGGGTTIPDVKITGDDLLIVFDRANRRKNRR